MNLSKKLTNWQNAQLITPRQGLDILAFESQQNKPKFLYVMIFLSVFCIGLGLISLVAANWQETPPFIKLSLDILILALVVFAIIKSYDNNKPLKIEGLLIVYALLIMASIGLVGQIYQLQPQGYTAYFIWAMVTSPLLYFSKKLVLPILWVPIFIISGLDIIEKYNWFENLYDLIDKSFPFALPLYGILAMSLAFVTIKKIAQKNMPKLVFAWGEWLCIFIVAVVVLMDFGAGNLWGDWLLNRNQYNYNQATITVILIGLGLLLTITKKNITLPIMMTILLFFALIYNFLPKNEVAFKLWGLGLSLSMLSLIIIYAYKNGQIKLLNIATALIALRLFIVYLQVFGSLLTTGLGLVSSGGVLLTIIWGWNKVILSKNKEA